MKTPKKRKFLSYRKERKFLRDRKKFLVGGLINLELAFILRLKGV